MFQKAAKFLVKAAAVASGIAIIVLVVGFSVALG